MALAKVEKKFLKGSPKKRVSTDAITRAYFGRQTRMIYSGTPPSTTSDSEAQNPPTRDGSKLSLTEVLALEAT